ncbi:hypothetical protein ACNQGP_04725 [Flavobacterium sp. GT2N3]|uniref:hypothetical protein n=1 Tax=unclassified Flavobacterium TaxID=196869 RepID=UPI003AAFEA4D
MKSLVLLLFFFPALLCAQDTTTLLNKSLQIEMGTGLHGSGDLAGLTLNTSYTHYFRKKVSYTVEVGTSIHYGSSALYYTDKSGKNIDGSYRFTTAGIQLAGKIGLSVFRNKKNDLGLRLGPLVRYQSSSTPDDINTVFPIAGTGFDVPISFVSNESPQNTLSIGGVFQLFYNYSISNKIYIGPSAGFQIDSNGDTITNISLACGMKF